MFKNNKLKIILSSVLILLPIIFGLIVWDDLPQIMTTHFQPNADTTFFSTKSFVVFALPLFFLALHIVCLIITAADSRQKHQTPKALNMIFLIFPMISLLSCTLIYSTALGAQICWQVIGPVTIGISLILVGNHMPKIRPNRTLGIKVTWTMRSEENWNMTHRFAGKLMVCGGFVMIPFVFFPVKWFIVFLIIMIVGIALFPTVYSYLIYKKHLGKGIEYPRIDQSRREKKLSRITVVFLTVTLVFISVIMFTGNIRVNCGDSVLEITTSYWTDTDINYSEIDSIEYRYDFEAGTRTYGFGSLKLMLGIFQNKEFGSYTLYSYTYAKEYIVLTSGEKKLVIGLDDKEQTQKIYETLLNKIGGTDDV